jgi:hypothetical protein
VQKKKEKKKKGAVVACLHRLPVGPGVKRWVKVNQPHKAPQEPFALSAVAQSSWTPTALTHRAASRL